MPDEQNDFDNSIFWFTTKDVAQEVIEKVIEEYSRWGTLSLADYCDMVGLKTSYSMSQVGWTHLDIADIIAFEKTGGWQIQIPTPKAFESTTPHIHAMKYQVWVACTGYCEDYEEERCMHATDDPEEAIDKSILMRDNTHTTEIRKPVVHFKTTEISLEEFAGMLGVTPEQVRTVWQSVSGK